MRVADVLVIEQCGWLMAPSATREHRFHGLFLVAPRNHKTTQTGDQTLAPATHLQHDADAGPGPAAPQHVDYVLPAATSTCRGALEY